MYEEQKPSSAVRKAEYDLVLNNNAIGQAKHFNNNIMASCTYC